MHAAWCTCRQVPQCAARLLWGGHHMIQHACMAAGWPSIAGPSGCAVGLCTCSTSSCWLHTSSWQPFSEQCPTGAGVILHLGTCSGCCSAGSVCYRRVCSSHALHAAGDSVQSCVCLVAWHAKLECLLAWLQAHTRDPGCPAYASQCSKWEGSIPGTALAAMRLPEQPTTATSSLQVAISPQQPDTPLTGERQRLYASTP
jgi:hypothetical protein